MTEADITTENSNQGRSKKLALNLSFLTAKVVVAIVDWLTVITRQYQAHRITSINSKMFRGCIF